MKIAKKNKNGYPYETDISVRKDTEDKNDQIKAGLEYLLRNNYVIDQIHDAVIATDLTGKIISWNNDTERQLDYTSDEALGLTIYHLYPEERHGYLTSDVLDILQTKGNFEIESTMRRKSGEVFFTHTSLSPLTDETGEVIGIISYSLDISERKNIEQSLKESEERLKLAIAGADDGIWDWDIDINTVFYSSCSKPTVTT